RSLDRSSRRLSSDCSGAFPCDHREMSKEEWLKEVERREFYKNYNAMDGAITAIVLGGFFAFVCLLVVYKTNSPTRPATQSNAEVDVCGEQRRSYVVEAAQLAAQEEEGMMGGMLTSPPILSVTPAAEDFECIPLGAFSYDGDIYYLDECGNYLFPVPSPDESALCSCSAQPPLEGALQPRRNSQ
ncbi:Putative LOC100679586, partial [Caligus rogercresseyi]